MTSLGSNADRAACGPRLERVLLAATLGLLFFVAPDLMAETVSFGATNYGSQSGTSGWRRTAPQWTVPISPTPSPNTSVIATGSGAALSASLSGFVWYDPDLDGVFDGRDSPIHDAHLQLFSMNDLAHPVASVLTDGGGIYQFAGLAAGAYALALTYPTSPAGKAFVGTLVDLQGSPVASGAGTAVAGKDLIVDVLLSAGYKGQGYNFAEDAVPISKRYFVTPEPGSVGLLASAALAGSLAWLLRRRRK